MSVTTRHAKPGVLARFAARFRPAAPVHMYADAAGIQPCCGQAGHEVPPADTVTTDPALVTCNVNARRAA